MYNICTKLFTLLTNGKLVLNNNGIYDKLGKLAYNSDVENLKSSVSNGKNLIANAITDKGVTTSSSDTFAIIANNISKLNIKTGLDSALNNATTYTCNWNTLSNYDFAAPVTPGNTFAVTDAAGKWSLHIETSGSVDRGTAMRLYGTKGAGDRNGKVLYEGNFNPTTNVLTISPWFAYQYEWNGFNLTYAASGTVTVLGFGTYTTPKGGTARGVKMRINKKIVSRNLSWSDFDFWAYLPDATITTTTASTSYTLTPTNFVFK